MESKTLKPALAVYVGLFLDGPFFLLGTLSFQQGTVGGSQFPMLDQ